MLKIKISHCDKGAAEETVDFEALAQRYVVLDTPFVLEWELVLLVNFWIEANGADVVGESAIVLVVDAIETGTGNL